MPAPSLVRLAWVNAVVHALGLVAAATLLRPGALAETAAERAAYLLAHRAAWMAGWAVWVLCALALVALLAAAAGHLRGSAAGFLAEVGLVTAAAGAAVDLTADSLFMTVLPELARAGPTPLFLTVERALGVAGQVVANGLYSVAVLLASLALTRGQPWSAAAPVRGLGLATLAAGGTLVGAGLVGAPRHLPWTSALTLGTFIGWCLAVARRPPAGRP